MCVGMRYISSDHIIWWSCTLSYNSTCSCNCTLCSYACFTNGACNYYILGNTSHLLRAPTHRTWRNVLQLRWYRRIWKFIDAHQKLVNYIRSVGNAREYFIAFFKNEYSYYSRLQECISLTIVVKIKKRLKIDMHLPDRLTVASSFNWTFSYDKGQLTSFRHFVLALSYRVGYIRPYFSSCTK